MKVRRNEKWVGFNSIEIGDVYTDKQQKIYMKIEPSYDECGQTCNAINLENGSLVRVLLENEYKVKLIKCELVID